MADPSDAIALGDDVRPPRPGTGRFQLLALSGGGYRGLFTARLLERLESDGGPMRERFDLIAGTSIGSIIAGALALGIAAGTVREAMERHGAAIFPVRGPLGRLRTRVSSLFRAPYDPAPLERVVDEILGARRTLRLDRLACPLLVPCVSHTRANVRLFRSAGLAGDRADDATLRTAMLASAAAPTYFPPRSHGTETLVDGCLVANAPEVVALGEVLTRLHVPLERIHTLGLGTASHGRARAPARYGRPGTLPWMARSLLEVTMAAQEDLALSHCRAVQGERYLRLDRTPSIEQGRRLALDRADASATRTLIDLADACHEDAVNGPDGDRLRRFLRHTARHDAPRSPSRR